MFSNIIDDEEALFVQHDKSICTICRHQNWSWRNGKEKKASTKLEQLFHKGKPTPLFTHRASQWLWMRTTSTEEEKKKAEKSKNFWKIVGCFGGEQNANKRSANNKQVKKCETAKIIS